ncbi:hypothetical protein NL108_013914 [Boleophthalmus pectinirostris]|nr:hypothetical protein NL108_013914 [Boleophthalmus pectinirostris]
MGFRTWPTSLRVKTKDRVSILFRFLLLDSSHRFAIFQLSIKVLSQRKPQNDGVNEREAPSNVIGLSEEFRSSLLALSPLWAGLPSSSPISCTIEERNQGEGSEESEK